jgi:hypothetical protein
VSRRVAIALVPVLAVVLAIEVAARVGSLDTYEQLLPAVLEQSDDPIFGAGEHDYASTQALVLLAAGAAGDAATAEAARTFLMGGLRPDGWGMDWTWDPFADGSLTVAGTSFAATTAIAIDALLSVGLSDDEARQVGGILTTWAEHAWTDGYYWYSLDVHDAIDTPNVSAMMAGATARFLVDHGDILDPDDAALLRRRVDDTLAHLAATHDERLRWGYSARHSIVNDLGNHVKILWGAERARDAGFEVAWTRDQAIDSIDGYGSVYPADIEQTPSMLARRGSPWQTSGTGSALAFSATWGGDVRRWANATCETLAITARVPRFDAHALLGMAVSGLCECRARPLPRSLPISAC